jgi:hypothetical protein
MSAADGEYENRINHSTDAQASDLQAQRDFSGVVLQSGGVAGSGPIGQTWERKQ